MLAALVILALSALGLGGGATTMLDPRQTSTASTRSTTPPDLADRGDNRAARKDRPQPRRTGTVKPPNATTRSPKPTPSPKPTTPPAPAWVVPTRDYNVTSGFGDRWGTLHAGVDLAAPTGTPIVAARSGTIELSEWYGGYGNAVVIDHGDGVETLYGHNSELLVSEGEEIKAGQRISLMGSTGDSSGSHLHFEVHLGDEPVDPVPYLSERGVDI